MSHNYILDTHLITEEELTEILNFCVAQEYYVTHHKAQFICVNTTVKCLNFLSASLTNMITNTEYTRLRATKVDLVTLKKHLILSSII